MGWPILEPCQCDRKVHHSWPPLDSLRIPGSTFAVICAVWDKSAEAPTQLPRATAVWEGKRGLYGIHILQLASNSGVVHQVRRSQRLAHTFWAGILEAGIDLLARQLQMQMKALSSQSIEAALRLFKTFQ